MEAVASSSTAPVRAASPTHAGARASGNLPSASSFWLPQPRLSVPSSTAISNALEGGELPRIELPQQRQLIVDSLRGAAILPGTASPLGRSGLTGAPLAMQLDGGMAGPISAISKPSLGVGARETLTQDVSAGFGISYMVPPVALRDDRVVSARVNGQQAGAAGVVDRASLEQSFRSWYDINMPDLAPDQRARLGRMDLELSQTMDYVLALYDRHSRNMMVDPASGQTYLIDHGAILYGDKSGDSLRPRMAGTYLPRADRTTSRVTVGDDALQYLRTRVSPTLLREIVDGHSIANGGAIASDQQVDAMAARLQHVLDNGWFEASRSMKRDFMFERVGNAVNGSKLIQRALKTAQPLVRLHMR